MSAEELQATVDTANELQMAIDFAHSTGMEDTKVHEMGLDQGIKVIETNNESQNDLKTETAVDSNQGSYSTRLMTGTTFTSPKTGAVRYNTDASMQSTYKFDKDTNNGFGGGVLTAQYRERPVRVKRVSINQKTGEKEEGSVKQLTGVRAEKAAEILRRKAYKAVGSAALTRATGLVDAFKSRNN